MSIYMKGCRHNAVLPNQEKKEKQRKFWLQTKLGGNENIKYGKYSGQIYQ
jgi:hypothetical protein